VYYIPYLCQIKEHLKGWDVVYKVSPHGILPVPNDEDYNLDSLQQRTVNNLYSKFRGYCGPLCIQQGTLKGTLKFRVSV
jgi:hypothetical protein